MKTEIISCLPDHPETWEYAVEKASAYITSGELVAIPTETVYGLAGSALYSTAAEKIYAAKGRPSDNPLIVHVAYPADAEKYAYPTPLFYTLAERFMPGPLTIILPKRPVIPDTVSGGLDTVAIRCPSHPIAHRLIEVSGHPIAAPSANRSGKPSCTTAAHVYEDLDGKIPLILDGGICDIGVESTVISVTDNRCTILRPGAITREMLSTVCQNVEVSDAVVHPEKAGDKPLSPGMKYKHYAPDCQVILLDGALDECRKYILANAEENAGVLWYEEERNLFPNIAFLSLGTYKDEAEHDKRLFSLLREADSRGLRVLYAKLPDTTGVSLAYYNRIIRAAGGVIHKLS